MAKNQDPRKTYRIRNTAIGYTTRYRNAARGHVAAVQSSHVLDTWRDQLGKVCFWGVLIMYGLANYVCSRKISTNDICLALNLLFILWWCIQNCTYMDQISIKTPNPKCRLFLKIDQYRGLAAGVWGPLPAKVLFGVVKQFCRFGIWSNKHCICSPHNPIPHPRYTLYKMYKPVFIHTGKEGRWIGEKVEGR